MAQQLTGRATLTADQPSLQHPPLNKIRPTSGAGRYRRRRVGRCT